MKTGKKEVFSRDGVNINWHRFAKTEPKTMKLKEGDLGFEVEVFIYNTKYMVHEKLDFLKITNVCSERHCEENEKTKHSLGENTCKTYYLIKNLNPKYISEQYRT